MPALRAGTKGPRGVPLGDKCQVRVQVKNSFSAGPNPQFLLGEIPGRRASCRSGRRAEDTASRGGSGVGAPERESSPGLGPSPEVGLGAAPQQVPASGTSPSVLREGGQEAE